MRGLALMLVGLWGCGGAALPELGDAQWLWPRGVSKAPAVVLMARDFDLEQAPQRADLVMRAADGWVAWINGVRLAAVETQDACDLAVLDLTRYVRSGGNRLVLEVRFGGGAAGVLGCVRLDGECRVPTDAQWWRPGSAGVEVLAGWSPEGVRGEGFERAPGDLGSRCFAPRPVATLGCHGIPIDLEPKLLADGRIETELPAAGRLELGVPAHPEETTIRFAVGGQESDALIAPGSPNFLELGRRPPGRLVVSGAPVSGAWLWPWRPECDS